MIEFLQDFWLFIKERKKFWLVPMVMVLLLLGMLLFFAEGAAAPYIYTLF